MKYIFHIITSLVVITILYSWFLISWYGSIIAKQNSEIIKWKEIQETLKKIDKNEIKNIENDENKNTTVILGELNNIITEINKWNNDTLQFWNVDYWTWNDNKITFNITNIQNYNSIDMFLISMYGYKNYLKIDDLNITYDKWFYTISIKWIIKSK